MMNKELDDPYKVLDIPYWATDTEIKLAFQKKLKETTDSKDVIEAYGKIRDPSGRSSVEWDSIRYCSSMQEVQSAPPAIDMEGLIRELAFCTPWELGDDTCFKK